MTVAVRVIPCLGVDTGRVVHGTPFSALREVSDLAENDPTKLAVAYERAGADELVFFDLTPGEESRTILMDAIRRITDAVGIPVMVRGRVRSIVDVDTLLQAGATKVGLNGAAVARPQLIDEVTRRFGPVLTLCVDAKRTQRMTSGFEVTTQRGARETGLDAVAWAVCGAELGVGEILLTSVDAAGSMDGFDLDLIQAVRAVVGIPVIASGGAGGLTHFPSAATAGASALLAASAFHAGELSIGSVKRELAAAGHVVR
jgi:cyclase